MRQIPSVGGGRCLAVALLAAGALWPAETGSADDGWPLREKLSNERTRTTWAFVLRRAPARANPSAGSRVVGVLKEGTEYRSRQPALVLSQLTRKNGLQWAKVRVPGRPNGRTGWVRRGRLGNYRYNHKQLRLDRSTFTARLYRDGDLIWKARIGVGTPDAPTPSGRFYVRERLVPARKDGIYGIFAFGTSAYSALSDWPRGGVVGVHGTNQPSLIPGRISHGCVRVRNDSIRRLRELMPIGTPILIR